MLLNLPLWWSWSQRNRDGSSLKMKLVASYSAFNCELTQDVLKVMVQIETGSYRCNDYLALRQNLAQDGVHKSWRQWTAEWMNGVVDHCNFRLDIVSVAMTYLDLLLSTDSDFVSTRHVSTWLNNMFVLGHHKVLILLLSSKLWVWSALVEVRSPTSSMVYLKWRRWKSWSS